MTDILYGLATMAEIKKLHQSGINKISVIMRHSARHYSEDIYMEPFMSLTDEGKKLSFDFGTNVPENLSTRFFSSYFGRCIETAYLIDKGFTGQTNGKTINNETVKELSPFYVNDIKKLITIILEQDTSTFIRNWIDGQIPESIIMNPTKVSEIIFSIMVNRFKEAPSNSIDILITHDWNMFLLKEFGLNLQHENVGNVEYLEGLILFESDGDVFITNHQTEPKPFIFP